MKLIKPMMRAAHLSACDWRLLVAATAIQLCVAFALRLMSLPVLRTRARRLRPVVQRALGGPERRVIWALEASGRRLAGVSTCLVRAIVAELALGLPQRPLRLVVGIRRELPDRVLAHAWVDDGNRIIIGGDSVEGYTPLVSWPSTVA